MNDVKKYWVPAGFAAFTLLVAAVAALAIPRNEKNSAPPAAKVPARLVSEHGVESNTDRPAVTTATATLPDTVVQPIAPLPANATFVPDDLLLRLSGMVNLANARNEHPDKNTWTQAIAAANNLLTGPCDCAQRNWLNRFVEMGNHALSDSPDEYRESASLLVHLGRNDKQAMEMSRRMN